MLILIKRKELKLQRYCGLIVLQFKKKSYSYLYILLLLLLTGSSHWKINYFAYKKQNHLANILI
jgi:hypothetical protein